MPVTIEIPTAFRRFTDGTPRVDCSAATVADALNELTSRFPDLSRHVRDDQGQIRQFLNVYLNEEDIRFLGGESCSLKEGDRVLLVPSIAGGCLQPAPLEPTSAQLFLLRGVSRDMRPRLLIYAIASLVLLAFHAPVRAIVSLFSDCREV